MRRKRPNSSPNFGEKPLQFPAKTFFFNLHLILAKKNTLISGEDLFFWSSHNFGEDTLQFPAKTFFFGFHSISATVLRIGGHKSVNR